MFKRISMLSTFFLWVLIILPPVALLGGLALQNLPLALTEFAGVFAAALIMGIVPGHVGKRAVPLRILLSVIAAGGVIATLGLTEYTGILSPLVRWINAVFTGLLFIVFVRLGTGTAQIEALKLLPVGGVTYLAAGIVMWAVDAPELNRVLFTGVVLFFVMIAFSLNGGSLEAGYAARASIKPPARIMRGNRVLIIGIIAVVAFVAAFDNIRAWATEMARNIVIGIIRILAWFANLFPSASTQGGEEGGGAMDLSGLGAAEEPAIIWEILQRVFFVITLVALVFLLYKAMRVLAQKLRRGIAWLMAYFKQFAQAVGEDYHDERESLLDLAELKNAMEQRARRQLDRLFNREKRWEQMDGRERVRYLVRTLYRRAGTSVAGIESMTIRESSQVMGIGRAEPETLSALYEKARYSEDAPGDDEVEALRRAVK